MKKLLLIVGLLLTATTTSFAASGTISISGGDSAPTCRGFGENPITQYEIENKDNGEYFWLGKNWRSVPKCGGNFEDAVLLYLNSGGDLHFEICDLGLVPSQPQVSDDGKNLYFVFTQITPASGTTSASVSTSVVDIKVPLDKMKEHGGYFLVVHDEL